MNNGMIDEIINVGNLMSRSISGSELAARGSNSNNTQITFQIIPQNDLDFEVEVQAAVNSKHGAVYDVIALCDQDEDTLVSIIPISVGCMYRFRHVTGDACRVLLTG